MSTIWKNFKNDKQQEFDSETYKMKIIINNIDLPFIITFQGFCSKLMRDHNIDKINNQKLNQLPYYMFNTFSKNNNYNYIFVCDKYQTWGTFNFDCIFESLKNIISHYSPKKIICIGESAGGYQSILFGNLFNVNKVIAFVPQIDIFTTNMNNLRKELAEKKNLLKFKYKNLNILQPFKVFTKIYVLSGKNDIIHLNNLNESDDNLIISCISKKDDHNISNIIGREKFIRLVFDEIHSLDDLTYTV